MTTDQLVLARHPESSFCLIWFYNSMSKEKHIRKMVDSLPVGQLTSDDVTHRHAGRVIESMLHMLSRRLSKEMKEDKEWQKNDFVQWIIGYLDAYATFVLDNCNDFLVDFHSNHVVNTVLEYLGGMRPGCEWTRQSIRFVYGKDIDLEKRILDCKMLEEIPHQFKHQLKRFANVMVTEQDHVHIRSILFGTSSPVTLFLLFVLRYNYPQLCQMVVRKLVEAIYESEESASLVCQTSASSTFVYEIILLISSETRLKKIWLNHLKGNLHKYWEHDIANYIVQRLIDAIDDEDLVGF